MQLYNKINNQKITSCDSDINGSVPLLNEPHYITRERLLTNKLDFQAPIKIFLRREPHDHTVKFKSIYPSQAHR